MVNNPAAIHKSRSKAMTWLIAVSAGIVAAAAVAQLSFGPYGMTPAQAWAALADSGVWSQPAVLLRLLLGEAFEQARGLSQGQPLATATLIVWNVRIPRVLVGIMVGTNLAYSGSIFQAVTRNELASPYLLGVSSGAGLAALLLMVFFPAWLSLLPLAAMAGGGLAFLMVYAIAWNRGASSVRLVLAGVIIAAIAGSLHTAVFFYARDANVFQNALAWTAGTLTGADWRQLRLVAPWTALTVVLGLAGARNLDLLSLGDGPASALGMAVERTRFLMSAVAIMAAGSSVAVAGLVGFVGLIVPHVVRSLVGSAHRRLLIGCLFAGPALLVSADSFARLIASPTQLPVGVVTGLLGGVFFLFLMRKRRDFAEP
jgi:iron complex transport system permease protein